MDVTELDLDGDLELDIEEDPDVDDPFSEEWLRQIAGVEELQLVTYIDMSLDSSELSLHPVGERLPALQQLKLVDSHIPRLRDMGTSFGRLQVLWISRAGLVDLSGVSAMPCLRELYASFNDINDLTPLGDVATLEVLDVEANQLEDVNNISYLAYCTNLRSLTLEANPLTRTPHYRQKVVEMVSHLDFLDDMPVGLDDRKPIRPPSATDRGGGGAAPSPAGASNHAGASSSSSPSSVACEGEGDAGAREMDLVRDGIKYAKTGIDARNSFAHLVTLTSSARLANDEELLEMLTRPVKPARPLSARPGAGGRSRARPGTAAPGGSGSRRPSTGMVRDVSGGGGRPGSAAPWGRSLSLTGAERPMTAMGRSPLQRPATAYLGGVRPGTASASSSLRGMSAGVSLRMQSQPGGGGQYYDKDDGSSSLTHGTAEVFCGNPVKQLRSRRIRSGGGNTGGEPDAHRGEESGAAGVPAGDGAHVGSRRVSDSPSVADGGAAVGADGSKGARDGGWDHASLLEQLRSWKMETAALLLRDDEGEDEDALMLKLDPMGGPRGMAPPDVLVLEEEAGEDDGVPRRTPRRGHRSAPDVWENPG